LSLLESSHLFTNNITRIAIRKGHYLRGYAYKFIELCSRELTEAEVKAALSPNTESDID
jgi:LysR family cys regulon transcriptional activator